MSQAASKRHRSTRRFQPTHQDSIDQTQEQADAGNDVVRPHGHQGNRRAFSEQSDRSARGRSAQEQERQHGDGFHSNHGAFPFVNEWVQVVGGRQPTLRPWLKLCAKTHRPHRAPSFGGLEKLKQRQHQQRARDASSPNPPTTHRSGEAKRAARCPQQPARAVNVAFQHQACALAAPP